MQFEILSFAQDNGCNIQINKHEMDITVIIQEIVMINDNSRKYQIQMKAGEKDDVKVFTASEIKRRRFLQEFSVFIEGFIEDEEKLYRILRSAIFQKVFMENEKMYQTSYNGLQRVNGKWMVVYTNGSLYKDGFHPEVYSGISGAYFPKSAMMDLGENKEIIERLFKEYNRNPEVFYPLFIVLLMAIINGYFRNIGEPTFMKLTLWLDGVSGSGKTELAKAAGMYLFSDESLNREVISVTGRRSYAMRRLGQSSGNVCILDDVKREAVRERKNSVKTIVDDYLRSVFQGKLTDPGSKDADPIWIDACAVITGEYIETNESQNARILYMKVDGFLKKKSNSNALRILQEHPMWLTAVCGGYICWFLKRIEESSFSKLVKEKLKRMRSERNPYKDINNAERLNENRRMVEMAAWLIEMYFQEIGMSEEFIGRFHNNASRSIKGICDDTFTLLGGEQMVVRKVMERIFEKCKIRKAHYQKNHFSYYQWKYRQEYFWIDKEDDFVWIEDYRRSMLKTDVEEHDQYNEKPYLLIREDRFIELFQAELLNLSKEKQISSALTDKLMLNLPKKLKEMQVLFKQHRSDSEWGRHAIDYPVFGQKIWYDKEYNSYVDDYVDVKKTRCNVEFAKVLQLNTEHPCIEILEKRMEDDTDIETIYEAVERWQIFGEDVHEIYRCRNAFTNSKSLYVG